jgi:hypothetical protein
LAASDLRVSGSSWRICAISEPAESASGDSSAGCIAAISFGSALVFAALNFFFFSFSGGGATRRVPSFGQILVADEKLCPHSLQVFSTVILPESSTKVSNQISDQNKVAECSLSAARERTLSLGYLARNPRLINHQLLFHISHAIIV